MTAAGWLSRSRADVPTGLEWLGPAERRVLADLRIDRRRADWCLGRFTAKAAVGASLGVEPERVQILAAADGAPEAWIDGERTPVSVSLSHRAGRAMAAVAEAPAVVGCDLEVVEERSDAFAREWLAPAERRLLLRCAGADGARVANLLWSAKEAAAKVRREGLRLDVRRAVAIPEEPGTPAPSWRPLRVVWPEAGVAATPAWWRAEPGWVMVVASSAAMGAPRALDGSDPDVRSL
jgi:4'-phosphopantetheinyl transferase